MTLWHLLAELAFEDDRLQQFIVVRDRLGVVLQARANTRAEGAL